VPVVADNVEEETGAPMKRSNRIFRPRSSLTAALSENLGRQVHERALTSITSHDRRAPKRAQFVVQLGLLSRGSSQTRRFVGDGTLEELVVSGSFVPDVEPIHVEATIEAVHEGVLVSGVVSTRWHGICRRCLEEAVGPLQVEFRELCVEDGDERPPTPWGRELVLDPIVHDACILNLPLAPLCDENCLGICAQCGTNRNVESCSCAAETDSRWAGLSALNGGRDEPSTTIQHHTS